MRQRSKFELFANFITLLLFVDCVSTENTTDPNVCSMAEGDSAKEIRSANLLKAFTDTYEHRLNLLFIIDRSKSIGEFEANQTKNFIYNLISFLSERRKILINNRYTRITVVSFGNEATPEFDGISDDENAIDSCTIFDQLNALRTNNDDTHRSDIAAALFRAKEIFDQSKANGDGDDVKQILWIFFDGAEGEPVSYEGHTSQEWAKVLRDGGVKIFSVGVGAWLKVAIKREYQVAELATSNDYYACVDNWMEILNKTRSNPHKIGNQNKPIYSRVADVYKSRCGTCSKGLECLCDAISMKYKCAALQDTQRPEVYERWIIPVAIGCGLFVFIIILVSIIIGLVRKKRNKTERNIQSSEGNHNREQSLATSNNRYSTPVFMSKDPTLEDQQKEDYPDMSEFENVSNGLEADMTGWSKYLFELKNDNHLMHLAIKSMTTARWATTPGFKMTQKETIQLYSIMDSSNTHRLKKFQLAGKTYIIDVNREVHEQYLCGMRVNRRCEKECAQIARMKDYLIVGVAEDSRDKACIDTVWKIYRYFEDYYHYEEL